MNCLNSASGSSGRATQCASGSTTGALDDEDDFGGHCSKPPRYIGAPLIMEAASKVDKCLARLHSLQGTVAVPKVHLTSSASSTTLSPIFSRSRSCLHGSPKIHENDKIRIHDVLRWSDDFSGKYKQERREKYMRRLSRAKTEVFDDKKDPLDPHGEWKHWSSPAGDVHKVISEILMASQIAKQITCLVNAALVQSDVSSDESGKRSRRQMKDTATSPNLMRNPVLQEKRRKGDPLHKYRVAGSADVPAKNRSNVAGSRKEVLYPKSKQPIPDRSCRPADENEVTLSTAKKMQSRRSPRGAVKESRPHGDTWSARDITNARSQQPQADMDMRAAKDVSNSKSQQSQANLEAAKGIPTRKSHQPQANVGAAKDILNGTSRQSQADKWAAKDTTNSNGHKSRVDVRAAKDTTTSKARQPQAETWAAKEITNRKSQRAQADTSGVRAFTNSKSQRRAAPWPESQKLVPGNEKQAPQTVRRARSSTSPPRPFVEKPKLIATSMKSFTPSVIVKQGINGPHVRHEPRVVATSSTTTTTAEPSTSKTKPYRQPLPEDTLFLSCRAKESSAAVNLCSVGESPLLSAAEIKRCNSSPTPLPRVFSSRPKGSGDTDDIASHISATSTETGTRNPSREDEFIDPALDGFTVVRSSIPESMTWSAVSSPQLKTPVKGTHQQAGRSNPLIGSLRHKFVMEATEIRSRSNSWRLNQCKSSRAVLFSNPAFAPASPNGARPASEERRRPFAAAPTHKLPVRSTSATRRVMDRIGRAISAGRRSISPEITRRLNSTRQKLSYLSPGKSLPSLISRLPSRGKRKPSPVPRPSIIKSTSCARPTPASGELPLPPGRISQQHLAAAGAVEPHQTVGNQAGQTDSSSRAASTDSSSYFSLRMLKDLNCNTQKLPLKSYSPDIAPMTSITRNGGKAVECHPKSDLKNEAGATGVLSSCRKWVEESAPPPPGGVCKFEKENVEPPPQRILIKENVVATGWDDEAMAPAVFSTSRSRKTDDINALSTAGGSYTIPEELKRSFSAVGRSFSTGRIRTGSSFLKRARDWMRTQTPNRRRSRGPNWDQPRQEGLVL